SQVQIWRNWQQTSDRNLKQLLNRKEPSGKPLAVKKDVKPRTMTFTLKRSGDHLASDAIGLILPTSLCSGQVANMIARKLNRDLKGNPDVSNFVALAHTEGCGNNAGQPEQMYARTM